METIRNILVPLLFLALVIVACACSSQARAGADISDQTSRVLTNSIGMEFVLIPAGEFMMGCSDSSKACQNDAKPQHRVTISQPFYLGKYEVTQEQWKTVMGRREGAFKGRKLPVEFVDWDEIQEFIRRLNEKEGTHKYRLPTEAEWEYAARAGTTSTYYFGDDPAQAGEYAWCYENSSFSTHPVGQKKPNPWGLYDMLGNVEEWVQDWYDENYYARSPSVDPPGPAVGIRRVVRGGSWATGAVGLRPGFRMWNSPDTGGGFATLGFRLAASVVNKP